MEALQVGDIVIIVDNPMTPSSIGKRGVITSVARDKITGEPLYKVRLELAKGTLPGWAEADCVKLAKEE